MNEWISDEAVYRTTPATPGLLMMFNERFVQPTDFYVQKIFLNSLNKF